MILTYEAQQAIAMKRKQFYGLVKLTENFVKAIKQSTEESDVRTIISSVFSEEIRFENSSLDEIFVDFLMSITNFGRKEEFDDLKFSTLIEMSASLFHVCFENHLDLDMSQEFFKEELIKHSLYRPPYNFSVFSLENVKIITDFYFETFFRHFEMYKYAFSPKMNVEIRTGKLFDFGIPVTAPLKGEADPEELPLLRDYIEDHETGLTPKELEEIMKGDSIHQVPKSKRDEWLRLKLEREKQEKFDRILQKELSKLENELKTKIEDQDSWFISEVEGLKTKKK